MKQTGIEKQRDPNVYLQDGEETTEWKSKR